LKKDTSYLNLRIVAGVQYQVSTNRTGRVFIENLKTNLLSVDTFSIKARKKLPNEIDVSSLNLGLDYEINTTNYRFNPRTGSEFQFMLSIGTRKIRKNNFILKISDPSFSYSSLYDSIKEKTYQVRSKLAVAHFIPLGRQSTLKIAINAGWFQSPSVFRNEVFQIGGYKLLRGFDEESIFASQYAVGTIEYRYIIGMNSFLFSFRDFGLTSNKSNNFNTKNQFTGGGAGMAFETKAGIFNISFAAGKRNDIKFNPRQSKIHLGYVNFF
jgi:hemolysin activation/secretion protein